MKSNLNSACISALLCGAVLIALPAIAAGATASTSTSTGGMTTSGDISTATAGNNAASVNIAAQSPAHRMSKKATAAANAAEAETTRQLNQQAAVNAGAAVH